MATNDCKHPLKHLYHTEHGIVFRCESCYHFHVVFGPIILPHDARGFIELKRLVDTLEPELNPATHIGERCYHLHTVGGEVGLVFTPAEIDELRALLAGAMAMNELDGMLKETLGPPPPAAEA